MEDHLRAVTDRVNELGLLARTHEAEMKERARREEATAAAWRDELPALRAATDDTRAEVHRLSEAGAGLARLREEVAQLARLVEAQRAEVVGFVAALRDTQRATTELAAAHEGLEELLATRVAETEARLAHQIATQWGDLETAVEGSVNAYVAGFVQANEELAGGQAALEERIGVLDDQVRRASLRMERLLERLAALEVTAPPATVTATDPVATTPARNLLDSLDRQLEAAARRLAARSEAGAGPGQP